MKQFELRRSNVRRQQLNERGDTIVEVLIAIVLISMILGGAYIASRNGLTGIRQSEERGEALKIAESQAENLRAFSTTLPAYATNTPPSAFCFVSATGTIIPFSSTLPPQLTGFPNQCVVNSDGTTSTAANAYHVGILYNRALNDFTIHVRWAQIGENGNNEVTIAYRAPY